MSKWTIAKETVAKLSEQAPEHGAAYVKNFIDYEVGSINVQHVDVQRLT